MSAILVLSIAQQVGNLIASIAKAKNDQKLAGITTAATTATGQIASAIEAHVQAHPELNLTADDVRTHIQKAVSAALATGDEAAERVRKRTSDKE